jgi:hypothetical protein
MEHMTATSKITLTPALLSRAAQHLRAAVESNSGVDAAALCALNGQCLWASDAAFERAAPTIARIGIMSLKLWVKVRSGKLDRIGLVTGEGTVDILFVAPLASVLVVSGRNAETGWLEGEPAGMLEAMGVAARRAE